MITEDYVSFEVARLLKEKGFDVYVRSFYEKDVYRTKEEFNTNNVLWNWNISDFRYSAPTLQMAMKWLREVHGLFIFISTWMKWKDGTIQYYYEMRNLNDDDFETLYDYTSKEINSYEKACEEAIKYCLENLI